MADDTSHRERLLRPAKKRHQLPGGHSQPPLFTRNRMLQPLRNTGSTIGHELTHGFDDEGRHLTQGEPEDWLTEGDGKELSARQLHLRPVFAIHSDDDIKINGKLTLGEDSQTWRHSAQLHGMERSDQDQKLDPIDGFTA